jgi:hypothetical protein
MTHTPGPVPYVLYGSGDEFLTAGGAAYSEKEAAATGIVVDPGFLLMRQLVRGGA